MIPAIAEVEGLLAESIRLRSESVAACLAVSKEAEKLASSLFASDASQRLLFFRTLCYLGNAQRLAGDDAGAEQSLMAASNLLQPDDSPSLAADVLEISASLAKDRLEIDRALKLIRQALPLRELAGDPAAIASCLVLLGALHEHTGMPSAGVCALVDALEWLRRSPESPDLRIIARKALHNLACRLTEAGARSRALEIYRAALPLFDTAPALDRLKLQWELGRVLRDMGRFPEAEASLRAVGFEYQSLRMHREAALVALDLLAGSTLPSDIHASAAILGQALSGLGVGGKDSVVAGMLRRAVAGSSSALERIAGFLHRLG